MKRSLLFLPDISGFTEFVQSTEAKHSQHVIAELLEILLAANITDLELAEVEGDALFFYKEESIPSLEQILAQVEKMFSAFYSHLKLLENNRICPCNACATAPQLQLKIIAHSGELGFITVRGQRKPFGRQVIEAHRLMKNSVESDNYLLLSQELAQDLGLSLAFNSDLYRFDSGSNQYDGKDVGYLYAIIDKEALRLQPFSTGKKVDLNRKPNLYVSQEFALDGPSLLEYITNYNYRHHWVKGVDSFEFEEDEVTRVGTEHVCVINGKHFDFVTVTKEVEPNQFVYGEWTSAPPPVDELLQFYIITPLDANRCRLEVEIYFKAKSPIKKLFLHSAGKLLIRKNLRSSVKNLRTFIEGAEKG